MTGPHSFKHSDVSKEWCDPDADGEIEYYVTDEVIRSCSADAAAVAELIVMSSCELHKAAIEASPHGER